MLRTHPRITGTTNPPLVLAHRHTFIHLGPSCASCQASYGIVSRCFTSANLVAVCKFPSNAVHCFLLFFILCCDVLGDAVMDVLGADVS